MSDKVVNNISLEDVKTGLNVSVYNLEFISWGHMSCVVAWAVATVLMGFCNGLWHGTPLAWEILIVKFIASAIGLGVKMVKREYILPELRTKEYMISLVIFLLVIAIAFNITHIVFSAIEFITCTSALCLHPATYWFLFVFMFILGLIILFELILIYYFWKYKRYVNLAILKFQKLNKIP